MKGRDELVHEVESLNITHLCTDTKEDLMDLLAVSHREHDVTGRPTLIPQYAVMRARNVKDLKEHLFDGMRNSSDLWIAEEKLDGMRAKLHLGENGNRIDSRHRSDVTYEYVEKTDSLPHLRDLKHFMTGTVLDGELIMPQAVVYGKTCTDSLLTATTATVNSKPERATELQERFGYCHYYVFDILFYCGRDVREMPYERRYTMVLTMEAHLNSINSGHFIRLPIRRTSSFETFYHHAIEQGGEGVMLKRLNWPYESGRQSKGMYKWKMQKKMDCFVTGFVPGEGEFSGLVGSLLVSVMVNDHKREVAAIQPGDLHFRKLISEADGALCDGLYGKVVKVAYQCKTKNNRLRHAVLERWLPDKNMYDCKGEVIS